MERYLTYKEYRELGGTLDKTPFNLLEFEARKMIDTQTLGKLQELEEQCQEVKMCIKELVDRLNGNQDNKNIASESVGSYSVSYKNGNEISQEYKDIIFNYLLTCVTEDGIPYLYRGV